MKTSEQLYSFLMGEFRVRTNDWIADTCSVNFDYRFQDLMNNACCIMPDSSRKQDYTLCGSVLKYE